MLTFTPAIQYCTGSPSQSNHAKGEKKRQPTEKEVKFSLFTDNIILQRIVYEESKFKKSVRAKIHLN